MLSGATDSGADVLLNEERVAHLLNVSVRTVQAWRIRGGGPPFVRCGRAIRYRPHALQLWIDRRTVASSNGGPE